MRGIDVVDHERAFVRTLGAAVRTLAGAKLREGMASLNQADVGGALQVFYNLRLLPERTEAAVEAVVSRVADRVASTFVPRVLEALGRKGESAGSPATKGAARDAEAAATRHLRRRAHEHAEDFASTLFDSSLQVWNLQVMKFSTGTPHRPLL